MLKLDRVPADQVDLVSLSSFDTLQLTLSPACFESVRDLMEVVKDLATKDNAAPTSLQRQGTFTRGEDSELLLQADASLVEVAEETETFNLFEIVNRSGLSMACYRTSHVSNAIRKEEGMQLASSNVAKPLAFRPATDFVHIPDFGRKVREIECCHCL